MKYSGVYFISNSATSTPPEASTAIVNTLVQAIETCFPTAAQQAPWALQYRPFRNTIPPGHTPSKDAEGKPQPFAHTLQHLFHLSSLEHNRAYICIQPPTGTSTVSAIPLSQLDAHASLVKHQFAALWQARPAVTVEQGTAYTGGVCTVHIGELKSTREGPQSGGIHSPGVVVCISTMVGADESDESLEATNTSVEDEEMDFEYAQDVIRDFWDQIKNGRDFGKSEVREVMMDPKYATGSREKDAAVRMWCEILRLRG
jgi:hypothetical protein